MGYFYTDDDLTRIDRAFLGPKGKRLPWVATYRTYGVSIGIAVGVFWGMFFLFALPFNQWTALLAVVIVVLLVNGAVRRMKRDVSLWSMAKAGYQEVTVPRKERPAEKSHTMNVTIPRWEYDAQPAPKGRAGRRTLPAPTTKPLAGADVPVKPGTRRAARQHVDH